MIDVAVVGAGPVGLWLAAELRLAGVRVVLLEQAVQRSPHSRGLWIQPRTLEVLDTRGMAEAHVSEGRVVPSGHFALMSVRLDMSVLRSPFPFLVALPQARTEELFVERALALGAVIRLGHRVTGVGQDGAGVGVMVEGPGGSEEVVRARFVVGCDGARSVVRESAGIRFDGRSTTRTAMLGHCWPATPPPPVSSTTCHPTGSGIFSSRGSKPTASTTHSSSPTAATGLMPKTIADTTGDGLLHPAHVVEAFLCVGGGEVAVNLEGLATGAGSRDSSLVASTRFVLLGKARPVTLWPGPKGADCGLGLGARGVVPPSAGPGGDVKSSVLTLKFQLEALASDFLLCRTWG